MRPALVLGLAALAAGGCGRAVPHAAGPCSSRMAAGAGADAHSRLVSRAPEVVTPFKCISCGKCVEACPTGALELVEVELAEIEKEVYHKHGRVCP